MEHPFPSDKLWLYRTGNRKVYNRCPGAVKGVVSLEAYLLELLTSLIEIKISKFYQL